MGRFAQGKFTLKNPDKYIGGRTPTYRSSWEFAFMRMCDTNDNITQWASEAIKIPYRNPFTGKHTIYVPDFFIVYADRNGKQHVELIEVKPANQTVKEQIGNSRANKAHYVLNQAKWGAARAYCKQKGMYFRVVNEGDIFHQGRKR
jgi:hypothetical protein